MRYLSVGYKAFAQKKDEKGGEFSDPNPPVSLALPLTHDPKPLTPSLSPVERETKIETEQARRLGWRATLLSVSDGGADASTVASVGGLTNEKERR